MASATELMDMDITKLSEMEFRVTMVKMMCRLENFFNKNIESLRAKIRKNLAEIKNDMKQVQSKLDALMARVNEAEE